MNKPYNFSTLHSIEIPHGVRTRSTGSEDYRDDKEGVSGIYLTQISDSSGNAFQGIEVRSSGYPTVFFRQAEVNAGDINAAVSLSRLLLENLANGKDSIAELHRESLIKLGVLRVCSGTEQLDL